MKLTRLRLVAVPFVAIMLVVGALSTSPASASPTDLFTLGTVSMSPGFAADIAALPTTSPYGAFVHFTGGAETEHRALLAGYGLTVAESYPEIKVDYALGNIAAFRVLTRAPGISYLESDRALKFLSDTEEWATRSRVAQEAVSGGPYFDASSRALTGEGIGVAIVDSGINAPHPDLANRVKNNYKIVCTTPGFINTTTEQCFGPLEFVDVGNQASTDTSSGHGTHVAGIVAGDGTASTGPYPGAAPNVRGAFTGVAPGATLYGFGTGEAASVLFATEAFQYIYDHYDEFTPRIRVINNSYGDTKGTAYDPNSVFSKLVRTLVQEKGVSVIFAAGNDGGDGTADQTSSFSKDPTPGVVSVANYDDAASGNRDNVLSSDSSRGASGNPTTYPDVSAPGTMVTSPCVRETQPVCNLGVDEVRWAPYYGTISGTSMATPNVAGDLALLYQARPGLTPPEAEALLQDTAHKFSAGSAYVTDPQNAGTTTSVDKGAGLVDVVAALNALGVAHQTKLDGSGPASVHINQPGDGDTSNGAGQIAVSGTADDGVLPPVVPAEETIFDGDSGDFSGPGAADIAKLTVQETPAGAPTPGLTYRMTVRDATDFGNVPSVSLRVTQNVNGQPFFTNINATPAAVTPGSATPPGAVATTASRSGNTITFFIPMANLGNPPSGAPAHNVFASSFINAVVDAAPGPKDPQTAGADVIVRPQSGRAYTILRPGNTVPPASQVKISVDNGLPRATTLAGSSPSYTWSTAIDGTALANGSHTVTATLFLNGLPATSHTVSFTIQRTQSFTYSVAITNPAGGETVPRAAVQVQGTTSTDDPATAQVVTLEVHNTTFSSGQLTATGTSPWTLDYDFGTLTAGIYALTARFIVNTEVKATTDITVVVPTPTSNEVSCSPRNAEFWRGRYKSGSKVQYFTSTEADQIVAHAVELSDGYFANTKDLKSALSANGNQTAEKMAAREFAALVLNLSAGDLSKPMSYRAGLSGAERLDPGVYNVTTVGATVNAADAWVRSQFPDRTSGGDLGGATELGIGINNDQGLQC
ncbi:MAG: S8 family serine peptidase [Actinomycetota bacterium]